MAEVGGIINIVGTQAMEGIHESRENMAELLGELEDVVNQRRKEINYDYGYDDYEARVCQSDIFFEKTLQEKVLSIPEIRNLYYKITSLFQENDREVAGKKMQEEYLADLVFESMKNKELKKGELYITPGKKEKSLKKLKDKIRGAQGNGIKILNLHDYEGLKCFEADEILKFARNLKGSGVRRLNLGSNQLGEILGKDGVIKFIKALRGSGVRSLNLGNNQLGNNQLGEILGKDGAIEFIKALRGSGIKSLNLWDNGLGEYLEVDGMIEFIKALKGSKVRELILGWNQLGEYLGKDGMIAFAKALRGNEIRVLDLMGNKLGQFLEEDEMIAFIKILEGSEIQYLNIGYNGLSEKLQKKIQEKFPNIHFRF
ncbi:hypothetical protein CSB09_02515 [Candidatus Gracilibacteria bacterium]|nr:MAG: hypothetical protein CSB09_02515 [Candidatus Gracilibacteria bacterium]